MTNRHKRVVDDILNKLSAATSQKFAWKPNFDFKMLALER
jgi:hypothetical protein